MQFNMLEMINIDRRSTVHYDLQIKESIKALILDQTFYYHLVLPTPIQLAKHLNIPEKTVVSAYKHLTKERFIEKSQAQYRVSFFELTNNFFIHNVTVYDAIIALGLKPSINCIEKRVMTLDEKTIKEMGFDAKKDHRYFYINRVYLGDNQPIMILENYLPLYIFPGIDEDFEGDEPLNAYLEEHYQLAAQVSKRVTKSVNLPQKLAQLLNERKHAASIQSTNRIYDKYDRLIDYGRSHTISSYYFQSLVDRDEMIDNYPTIFNNERDIIQ